MSAFGFCSLATVTSIASITRLCIASFSPIMSDVKFANVQPTVSPHRLAFLNRGNWSPFLCLLARVTTNIKCKRSANNMKSFRYKGNPLPFALVDALLSHSLAVLYSNGVIRTRARTVTHNRNRFTLLRYLHTLYKYYRNRGTIREGRLKLGAVNMPRGSRALARVESDVPKRAAIPDLVIKYFPARFGRYRRFTTLTGISTPRAVVDRHRPGSV